MNLHEYQSKQLLAQYGIPVEEGVVCKSVQDGFNLLTEKPQKWVAKCQVHAGGRGKAGGVKIIQNSDEATAFCQKFLGKRLVTAQTDEKGKPVNQIYFEPCVAIKKELYLSLVIDRQQAQIMFVASSEGGMDIETLSQESPECILKVSIDYDIGAMPYQGRALAFKLGLSGKQINQFSHIFCQLYRLFVEKDLSLLEINPLLILEDDQLLCGDAKITIDSNALYRHPELQALEDPTQVEAKELQATKHQLNYVALDGNIGCMVNGAGLAMGTLDIIAHCGGNAANFLDLGGTATQERVAQAFKLILSDDNVKTVLVNIFGGIVQGNLIAEGVIAAIQEVGTKLPVIIRLEGSNATQGHQLLADSGLNVIIAKDLQDGVQKAIAAVEGK